MYPSALRVYQIDMKLISMNCIKNSNVTQNYHKTWDKVPISLTDRSATHKKKENKVSQIWKHIIKKKE